MARRSPHALADAGGLRAIFLAQARGLGPEGLALMPCVAERGRERERERERGIGRERERERERNISLLPGLRSLADPSLPSLSGCRRAHACKYRLGFFRGLIPVTASAARLTK